MQLRDARILLTGASGGIGQVLVEQFCAGEARLLLVGRDSLALEALARRYPGQISLVCADLSQRSGRQTVLAAARRFGAVNCVINAAGVNQFSLLEEQDEDAIARLIGVNVTATLQLTHLLLPLLRQQPRALLVNLGSTFGSIGYPGFTAYCASKVCPARLLRSAAARTGRQPHQGALRCTTRHPHGNEQRRRGGDERRAEGGDG